MVLIESILGLDIPSIITESDVGVAVGAEGLITYSLDIPGIDGPSAFIPCDEGSGPPPISEGQLQRVYPGMVRVFPAMVRVSPR